MGILFPVNWLGRMAALLLLVLWVPVTSHCILGAIPSFEFFSCCLHVEPTDCPEDDCEMDGCKVVESGEYKVPDDRIDLSKPVGMAFVLPALEDEALLVIPQSARAGSTTGPPGLSIPWQFHVRAAPLARAPSFLS